MPFVIGNVYLRRDEPYAGIELDCGIYLLVTRAAKGRSLVAEERRVMGTQMCD